MPDVGEVDYVLRYWQDLGMVGHGGMGHVRLSATELIAWQEGTSIKLLPWEFSVIREMSSHYIASLQLGEKPECPPPYGDPINKFDRDVVGKKVTSAFKALLLSKSGQKG